MDMRTSFDSRDDRHAYVGYVFQNLSAFIVNLAPNAGIGNIAKRAPIDPNNEVAICTRQYDDLVCSILRNPVKSIHDLRMVLCRESAPPAIAVKFDNQHALGISRHLHGAIGAEVVSLMGLHSTLLGLLRFARNDISTRSEFQPARSSAPPLQLSSLSASWAQTARRMADRLRSPPRRRLANLARALDAEQPSACAYRQFFRTAEVPPFPFATRQLTFAKCRFGS